MIKKTLRVINRVRHELFIKDKKISSCLKCNPFIFITIFITMSTKAPKADHTFNDNYIND